LFEGDASHTAQGRPLGSRIENSPEPRQQKVFSILSGTKLKTRRKILDLNPTAILPHFKNLLHITPAAEFSATASVSASVNS
jgi:hypothetical protein